MKNLIRHILKESKLQQELKQVIEDGNIFDAIDMVGGLSNFKIVFKEDPQVSEILDDLTGVVDFSIYDSFRDPKPIVFPFQYEIIGIEKNVWNTNSWPVINLIYNQSKLTSEEKDKLISIISSIINDNTEGKIKTKTFKFKDPNFFHVGQINGKYVDIHRDEFPFSKKDVKRIHDKLYGGYESLNESHNREIEKNIKAINVLLSLVSWDGLCDIWAEYNPDDKEYEIRSKTASTDDLAASISEIEDELNSLEDSLRSMGIRVYIYTPWYVDNCKDEVEFMNESKSENKKLDLTKMMIYDLFDEVEFIEVDTNYEGKPLIKIYHDVEDTAANYDNWLGRKIQNEIEEMTGGTIILSPYWAPSWDTYKKNANFYIDVEKIQYDNMGNVIN
jgi:hypothetical protein